MPMAMSMTIYDYRDYVDYVDYVYVYDYESMSMSYEPYSN